MTEVTLIGGPMDGCKLKLENEGRALHFPFIDWRKQSSEPGAYVEFSRATYSSDNGWRCTIA